MRVDILNIKHLHVPIIAAIIVGNEIGVLIDLRKTLGGIVTRIVLFKLKIPVVGEGLSTVRYRIAFEIPIVIFIVDAKEKVVGIHFEKTDAFAHVATRLAFKDLLFAFLNDRFAIGADRECFYLCHPPALVVGPVSKRVAVLVDLHKVSAITHIATGLLIVTQFSDPCKILTIIVNGEGYDLVSPCIATALVIAIAVIG